MFNIFFLPKTLTFGNAMSENECIKLPQLGISYITKKLCWLPFYYTHCDSDSNEACGIF